VTFSTSYFDVDQALVALKGTPIVTKHTPADLKTYVFGDQIGTTSLAFINSQIQPTQTPKVYESLNDVKQGLQTHQIAALVADTPTAQFISSSEIKNSVLVGQFPSSGEHFGLLFHKGNPLVGCVDKALSTLNHNGTLTALQKKYPAGLPERADTQALMVGPPQPSFDEIPIGETPFGEPPARGRGCWAAAAGRFGRVHGQHDRGAGRPGRPVPAGPRAAPRSGTRSSTRPTCGSRSSATPGGLLLGGLRRSG